MLKSGKSTFSVALHFGIGETTEQFDASEKLLRSLMRQGDFTSMDFFYFASLIERLKRKLQKAAKQTTLARFCYC